MGKHEYEWIDSVEEGRYKFHENDVVTNSQVRIAYKCQGCGEETHQAAGSLFKHDDLKCNACRRADKIAKIKARNKRKRSTARARARREQSRNG